tara:strand:+ start:1046 stop:1438 length:393 start_codon:yes stop_codon:yes gene_type:complete
MKPRFEQASKEVYDLLKAAQHLESRIAKKEGSMPDYGGQEEGSTVGYARFEMQPSGVPNAYYNTNNVLTQVEDVTNKGAISENSDVLTRESPYYPTAFSTTGALENFKGGDGPTLSEIKKSIDRLASRLN